MGKIVRFFKSRRGQSMVEMALVLPILLLLVAGAIDLGRAFNAKLSITNAAREGARYGSWYPEEEADIKNFVRQELTDSAVPPDEVTIDPQLPDGTSEGGHPIRVTVTYDFSTILGGLIGMPKITMRSATDMTILWSD